MDGNNIMPHDRMLNAIGRMESALARLEAIDMSRPQFSADTLDLQHRHDRLRQEATATLADIDRLINQVKG
jgi:hypothetical protein